VSSARILKQNPPRHRRRRRTTRHPSHRCLRLWLSADCIWNRKRVKRRSMWLRGSNGRVYLGALLLVTIFMLRARPRESPPPMPPPRPWRPSPLSAFSRPPEAVVRVQSSPQERAGSSSSGRLTPTGAGSRPRLPSACWCCGDRH